MDPIRPIIRTPGGTPPVDRTLPSDRVERKTDDEREEDRDRRREQPSGPKAPASGRGEVAPPDGPPDDGHPHIDVRV